MLMTFSFFFYQNELILFSVFPSGQCFTVLFHKWRLIFAFFPFSFNKDAGIIFVQHNILRRQQHLKTRQGSVKHLTFYYLSFYNFDNLNWSENFKLFMFAFLGVKSRKSRQYFVYIFKSTCKLQSYSYDYLNAFYNIRKM